MKIINIDELTEAVKRLNSLLEDRQDGLMSWCMAYGELMTAINDFWTRKKK
jgi:hypothetical protein